MKMFGRFYVPIKTIDSSMSSSFGDLNTNESRSIKKNPDIEPILKTLIKEIELNQLQGN